MGLRQKWVEFEAIRLNYSVQMASTSQKHDNLSYDPVVFVLRVYTQSSEPHVTELEYVNANQTSQHESLSDAYTRIGELLRTTLPQIH